MSIIVGALYVSRPVQGIGNVNGIQLTYDPSMVTQRALFMQGGVNSYNTPGYVKQLGSQLSLNMLSMVKRTLHLYACSSTSIVCPISVVVVAIVAGVSYPSPAFDRYESVMPGSQMAVQVGTSPLSNLLVANNVKRQQYVQANTFVACVQVNTFGACVQASWDPILRSL